MEALSPQTYRRPEEMAAGDRSCVADLARDSLPWEAGERSRRNRKLYYLVILGAIPMGKAVERLTAAFGEDEERGPRLREKAATAAVLVDRDGMVVENGISVSSFAWALPQALQLAFDKLGGWPEAEPAIIDRLDGMLRRYDEEGRPLPLDRASIDGAQRWLAREFGLADDLVEPPSFAVRIHHPERARHHPEAALLNSFFLGDLTRAAALVREGAAPAGLRRYLGLEAPPKPIDLLADRAALEQAVAPAMMPLARWPHPGGHSLVLLQQAAVNLVRSELTGGEGLIAINGPPGTGKTTLLRDLVAASVLDRALAMAAFDDPERAFTASGEKMAVGDKAAFQVYALAPSLKGHEVVVASSNNKAVENVSRELPAATAIGRDPEAFAYFRTVAKQLGGLGAAELDEGEADGIAPEPVESWGMIAAVLGNRRNLAAFQQAFWWDGERSLRLYLKAAKGDAVGRKSRDPDTGAPTERHLPIVVAEERPPLPGQARTAWREARDHLLTLKRETEAELDALEEVRRLCCALAKVRRDTAETESAITSLATRKTAAASAAALTADELKVRDREHERCKAAVAASRSSKPGWAQRLFRTGSWKAWAQSHAPLADAAALAADRRRAAERSATATASTVEELTRELRQHEEHHGRLRQDQGRLTRDLDRYRPALGERLIDDALFERGHDQAHKASPWLPDALQRKREDLFAAALAAHRAFIDASAHRVYHNLGALMEVFANGPPRDEAKRKLVGDLWSTLHMAVPVVSTTFASADRMLGALPPGGIGWLLIDEAGQALPQAAIGAITRARRTVVVGDPLQIEPVVAMPERLTADLCRRFAIDRARWAAPQASAQTVADRASPFQAAFRSADGPRRVGVPLLVHRRSQEPMFGLFNRIAYAGQMVQATPPRDDGVIGKALGPSRWFDVEGGADTKWCPAEGEAVVGLLKRMVEAGVKKPDLFIVSPFRIVAQELRRRLEREDALFAALDLDPRAWVHDRVGTIHTVQGREADGVVLVLGAPAQSQRRARTWAAEAPNVFNVALSRARQSFYVVGSRDAWADVGHGRGLATLPYEHVTISPGIGRSEAQPERQHSDDDPPPERRSPERRHGPTL